MPGHQLGKKVLGDFIRKRSDIISRMDNNNLRILAGFLTGQIKFKKNNSIIYLTGRITKDADSGRKERIPTSSIDRVQRSYERKIQHHCIALVTVKKTVRGRSLSCTLQFVGQWVLRGLYPAGVKVHIRASRNYNYKYYTCTKNMFR